MELMSSLLLCVLVVLLPQTSGRSGIRPKTATEIKFNNSLLIQQKPNLRKHVLLNINGPPLVNNASELQSVFSDFFCNSCHRCMERAIKAEKAHFHIISHRPSSEELQEDVLINEISYRTKRDIPPTDQTLPEVTENVAEETKTTKKTKTRKHKANKSVTVTKYNMDGEVYALRVKETQVTSEASNDTKPSGSCQVYNVKKSYPCESPESESLLVAARRRAGKKKSKKQEQEKTKPNDAPNSTTAKVRVVQTSSFKKREVDNSDVPENFMPSIEDLY